jgi:hypothetical protein
MQDFALFPIIFAERINSANKMNKYEKKHFIMDGCSDAHTKQLFYQRQHYGILFAFEGIA